MKKKIIITQEKIVIALKTILWGFYWAGLLVIMIGCIKFFVPFFEGLPKYATFITDNVILVLKDIQQDKTAFTLWLFGAFWVFIQLLGALISVLDFVYRNIREGLRK